VTAPPKLRLEQVLTDPRLFGLVTATPLQRAICRASDGLALGKLWEDESVRRGFGGTAPPEGTPPDQFLIIAGVRSAKSTIAAAKAIVLSQTVDLSKCSPGDEIRIPVLSTDKDAAGATFNQIAGHIQARPALRSLLMGAPTADALLLRHPSGRPIEVKVTALAKYGSTLVGRWLAGCIFDEAPRMAGASDGVKNLDEAINAISARMLGQIMMIGSPYAPFGPIFELVQKHFGNPSPQVVVVRGRGPDLNPVYWTPKRCEKLKVSNPSAYQTDVDAEFADAEEALFPSAQVDAAMRKAPAVLEPKPGHHYSAAMDPATRGNAWTLVVLEGAGPGGVNGVTPTYRVALPKQWIGSKAKPLRPRQVIAEVAELLKPYGVDTVTSDQHAIDAYQDIAEEFGLSVYQHDWTAANKLEYAQTVQATVADGCLELPPDPVLRQDLLQAKKKATQNGVTLFLPGTADGRHCDYLPALALALANPPEMPDAPEAVTDPLMDAALRRLNDKGDPFEAAAMRLSS
jgi:hypothetical protein